MKARALFSFVVAGLLTCSAQISTNVSSIVLAEGRFQRDSSEVARELPRALESAVLVMHATVVDRDSTVNATVGTPQGWRAALVKPTRILKGNRQPEAVWVANTGFRIDGLHWSFPVLATNGQACILVLTNNASLSQLCQTNVYEVVHGMEVK